jgi:hypothetical protein
LQLDINHFKAWIEFHGVVPKTIQGWWDSLECFKAENPHDFIDCFGGDYNPEWMVVEFIKVGVYISEWLITNNQYVACYVSIKYKGNDHGQYKLIFDIFGNIVDDYWTQ